ncbi:MAG: radical SAM protein [Myxococcales bacterium]|nr:radical SAM protein [Myxococcales bacterium]
MSRRTARIGGLRVVDHDRAAAGMTYVYPVVSRRAGGVSIGVNLNPNDACNWRCVYCQVPGLVRGKGPHIDLGKLAAELDEMLEDVVRGDFMPRAVPEGARRLEDVAFSGNGEPTTSPDFPAALEVVATTLARFGLAGTVAIRLITNGSKVERPEVRRALERLGELGGEVWFKLDRATAEGSQRVNGHGVSPERHLGKLRVAAAACRTWVQSCWFRWGGEAPAAAEQDAFVGALAALVAEGVPLGGVHLYTLARPSHQPEAPELAPLDRAWLERLAARLEGAGLHVKVSV